MFKSKMDGEVDPRSVSRSNLKLSSSNSFELLVTQRI